MIFFLCWPIQAAESLLWLTDDADELQHFKQQSAYSISMDTLNLLFAGLAQDNIQFDLASVARIERELTQNPNTCVANRLKTPERLQNSFYSLPLNLHPLPQLFFYSDKVSMPASALNNKGELVSLAKVLESNPKLKLAIHQGVSYGPDIDPLIAQVPKESISYLSLQDRFKATPKLLTSGMVDLSIEYPSHFYGMLSLHPKIADLASVPFARSEQVLISYVACSKSEFGKQMIANINQALGNIYNSQAHIQAHLAHIPPATHDSFMAEYKKIFDRSAMPVMKVVADHFPPWMVANNDQAPFGIDIDIISRVADEIGVRLEFVKCPFARCIRMMQTGEADLYPAMYRTPEREAYIRFISPPTFEESPQALYMRVNDPDDIQNYEDLKGKTIGVVRHSQYFEKFDHDDSLRKVASVDYDTMVDMLIKGRIRLFIGSEAVVDYTLKHRGLTPLFKKASYRWNNKRDVHIGLSAKSAHVALRDKIEAAVKKLKQQDQFESIYQDWRSCCGTAPIPRKMPQSDQ